ncbi:hypothetical protein DAI22_01g301700 [Oryza sativa Japonica Group]|nr:hypothetical protein DAI22_01g301700 [Oryza sativa Japonica Group]
MGSISGHTLNLRFVQGSGFTRSLRPIRDWGSMDREGMQQPGSRVQENRSEDTLGALEVPLALSYAVRPRPASKVYPCCENYIYKCSSTVWLV